MIYYGLWETPLKHQLDAYINKTGKRHRHRASEAL